MPSTCTMTSSFVSMRSTNGYLHLLAGMTGISLVDMSSSGSTTQHILRGGQMFLGAQLAAIGHATRLVIITSGGNDVGYIGDLMSASGSSLRRLLLKALVRETVSWVGMNCGSPSGIQ
jgi:hypothetical protein